MDLTPDFVTVLHTNNPKLFLVVVMTWHQHEDEYAIRKVSQVAFPRVQAEGLAKSWAAAIGVEVR